MGPRAQERIRARGRSYEQGIQAAYLERLRDPYCRSKCGKRRAPVSIVDLGDRDLLHDAAAFSQLCDRLEKPMEASFEVLSSDPQGFVNNWAIHSGNPKGGCYVCARKAPNISTHSS
ncbi:MAG: deoxynucleoside kinase [Flavobacteriales bacterium]|nr:deoxynucleoside kinase [Flavobacteriales bacterium]